MSAIAEWIREATRRSRGRWYREHRAEVFATRFSRVLEEGPEKGYLGLIRELYNLG